MDRVLTREALGLVAGLTRQFREERARLLRRRHERQLRFDAGELPDFLPATAGVRKADWTVAAAPADFDDRRVEITGPAEPKMMINALNSGAKVFMADCEDALSPPWTNVISAQTSCMDAVRRTPRYTGPEGKHYRLADRLATLVLRPRGWHLDEAHLVVDGQPVPAALFDFGLISVSQRSRAAAPRERSILYLPKLESHLEARLWNACSTRPRTRSGCPEGPFVRRS